MNRLTLFLVLLFASGAYAGEHAGMTFNDLDTNQDGQVSAEEAGQNPRLSEMWNKVDEDANGSIDSAEFSAFETMEAPTSGDAE